jgi:hypothetical protein
MSFDSKAFMKAKFEARTEEIDVPDLKEFFGESKCVWKVRGLTGHELAQANEAKDRNQNIEAILEAIVSHRSKETAEAVKELVGLNNKTPGDVVQRIEMLKIASVDPVCDEEMAVKLCTYFPGVFIPLTNTIRNLTGMGATVKKKQTNSGQGQTSETP